MIDFAHVGIQKTGSTWLQYGLFNRHPQVEVVGPIVKGHRLERPGYLVRELYASNFDEQSWFQEFQKYSSQFRPNRVIGISNEQLSGHIFDASLGLLVAERMYDLFGDIKIILVLRNPVTFIQSAYVQAIKSGSMILDFHSFLGDPKWQSRIIARVDYMTLVDNYHSLFSHVLVLPYELLCDDAQSFLNHICSFLGIASFKAPIGLDKDPGIPFILQEKMRRTNRLDLRLWPHRRYISRTLKHSAPLLSKFFPQMDAVSLNDLESYGFDCFHAENYQIWSGKLAKYNYFQTELNSKEKVLFPQKRVIS